MACYGIQIALTRMCSSQNDELIFLNISVCLMLVKTKFIQCWHILSQKLTFDQIPEKWQVLQGILPERKEKEG